MNEETRYVINILVSMIPIGIVGVFFKDEVRGHFRFGTGRCGLLPAADSSAAVFLLLL